MSLVLALDQGTSATKALAINQDRDILARHSVETPLTHPEPGWAQNDPQEIREATIQALEGVLAQDTVDPSEIEALGITNQRETTLAWDPATGEPLAPAISWQCRRTEPICETIRADEDAVDTIRQRSGLVVDPYFSATKMRWMLDNVKPVQQAEATGELLFGTIDAFLIHSLTGEHATDASNASRTLLYNLHEEAWDPELASLLQVPMETLPDVRNSSGPFGTINPSTQLGSQLPELDGVPITGVAGDQQASLFGHGCLHPGEAKGTLGTGAFFLVNTGPDVLEPKDGILSTVAWQIDNETTYALEGSAFACASALEWATQAGWLDSPDALDAEAAGVDDAGGATFVPALYGLAAPEWDANAKAALMGITASTTRSHIARAIAEGLTAQNTRLLDALEACGQPVDEIRLDGGVSQSALMCRLMADAANQAVHRSKETELTGLGAAGLAGLEVGLWEKDELHGGASESFEPNAEAGFLAAYADAVDAVR